jgi:hypothetical protein
MGEVLVQPVASCWQSNRIAMIKAVTHDDYKYHTQINNKATWMGKCCMGAAEAWFLDGL